MAKEGFNWKSIFINENDDTASKENNVQHQFQPQDNKFPDQIPGNLSNQTVNPFMNEILAVYEKGFESLNVAGFDFFELYKSVLAVGVSNPQSYQMAFTMGKTISPDLSKQFLLDKASYYISEIEKVYTKYDTIGNTKKKDLNDSITKEKQNLSGAIADLETRILQMQQELEVKKADLQKIDYKNSEHFTEIQLKIDANNLAKHKILESINTVITGINQYL